MDKKRQKLEEMFDSLVNNGIDFLEHAIDALKEKPKYAVINFCSGIEVLLKARLLLEHWALVFETPADADFQKFKNGDAYSVSMENAIKRLKHIAEEDIPQEGQKSFNALRLHRNKFIHFYHEGYANDASFKQIIAEQCVAWFYMHQLLTQRWATQFKKHSTKIGNLNRKMHAYRAYLGTKYDQLSPQIDIEKRKGFKFSVCPSCKFEAGKEENILEPLISINCLVCEAKFTVLQIHCFTCNEPLLFHKEALEEQICDSCNRSITLSDIESKYDQYTRDDTMDGIYCAECEYAEPHVIYLQEKYLCLVCYAIHEHVAECEWCNATIAGTNGDDSYLSGCLKCDGKFGQLDDD